MLLSRPVPWLLVALAACAPRLNPPTPSVDPVPVDLPEMVLPPPAVRVEPALESDTFQELAMEPARSKRRSQLANAESELLKIRTAAV